MIFSDDEVKGISDLAGRVGQKEQFKSQLNALVQMARKSSLAELQMEIEIRSRQGKLDSGIAGDLSQKLGSLVLPLHKDPERAKRLAMDKRALFIKNIVRLAVFSRSGRADSPRSQFAGERKSNVRR